MGGGSRGTGAPRTEGPGLHRETQRGFQEAGRLTEAKPGHTPPRLHTLQRPQPIPSPVSSSTTLSQGSASPPLCCFLNKPNIFLPPGLCTVVLPKATGFLEALPSPPGVRSSLATL